MNKIMIKPRQSNDKIADYSMLTIYSREEKSDEFYLFEQKIILIISQYGRK